MQCPVPGASAIYGQDPYAASLDWVHIAHQGQGLPHGGLQRGIRGLAETQQTWDGLLLEEWAVVPTEKLSVKVFEGLVGIREM